MNEEVWAEFLKNWGEGEYEKAVGMSLEQKKYGGSEVVNRLFHSKDNDSKAIVGLSFLDIIYDYLMIDPTVIHAIDFARKQDLNDFFTFQIFADKFDLNNAGEITRLKGYTAEHLIALELQGKGHEVSFPESSNQAGYDLLVDGQQFQVKSLSSVGGVQEHFKKYPNIPVLVNKELAEKLEPNPMVYGTEVSHESVETLTRSTLKHTAEFDDLDIPVITLGITTVKNGHKIIANGLDMRLAGLNVANELSARSLGGLAGKGAGILIGPLLGPAGLVVLPMVFGLGGAYGGKKITSSIKKLYTQKQRRETLHALKELIETILLVIPVKKRLHTQKFSKVEKEMANHKILNHLKKEFKEKANEKERYLNNKGIELEIYLNRISNNELNLEKEAVDVLDTIVRTQVHPSLYQVEILKFGEVYKKLIKI